jgi:DUF4097 and DUF4098 domain-containing protein YvlB
MASVRSRSGSIFSGVALLTVGLLLLLHNYRGYELGSFFFHWWPLLLILLGGIKLFERTVGTRIGQSQPSAISTGEILLLIGLLALVGIVVGVDYARGRISENWGIDIGRNTYENELEVAPKTIAPNARITVRGNRGDITVRASDSSEIHVTGKVNVKGWDEDEARKVAKGITVELAQNGDGYEIHPTGPENGSARTSVDMEISIPLKSTLTIRNDKGDVAVSGMHTPVTVNSGIGDIEVRDTEGDVNIDLRKGDVRVSDAKGDVKITGHGGDIDVSSITGALTLNGEFFGSIRLDKLARGLRFISNRTDLTLTELTGHLELSSGSLEIADAPGDLTLRTTRYDVNIENPGGKVKIDDRDGDISVRFSTPPKDDIDITNSSGAIALSIPGNSNFQVQADCRSCDIDTEFDGLQRTSTSSGDSHLQGKNGNGRGPRVTLKTTYKNISLTKTS